MEPIVSKADNKLLDMCSITNPIGSYYSTLPIDCKLKLTTPCLMLTYQIHVLLLEKVKIG